MPLITRSSGISEGDLSQAFEEITTAAVLDTKYAMPYERNRPIYVARGFKVPLEEAWAAGKYLI